jgi:hypothetical protein
LRAPGIDLTAAVAGCPSDEFFSIDTGHVPTSARLLEVERELEQATAARPHDPAKLTYGGCPYRYPQAVELVSPAPLRIAYDVARRSERGRAMIDRATRALRGARGRCRDGFGAAGSAAE